MRKKFLSLFILLLLGACHEDDSSSTPAVQWNYLGLTGHIVNKVQVIPDKIYAATDKGFYALERNAGNQNWELLGFENKPCQSFLIIDEEEMIISLVNRQEASQTGLYKTSNGGQSWTEFTNGFGGAEGAEPVWDITVNPKDSSIYYAVGEYVVARSTDKGLHWEPLFGNWQAFTTGMDFVKLSPHDPESIWVGGQNAIEQGYVLYSANGGTSWEQWFDLVEAPSVAKEAAFHPSKPGEVYLGFEGGLLKTPDNGNTWETLIDSEENRFFFGIGIRQSNPSVMYAAGWLKRYDEPQTLIIFTTKDGGQNWHQYTYEEEDFGGVYDLVMLTEGGQDKLYLGLYKGGIYEVVFNQ